MKPLDEIINELRRRKIVFSESELLNVLWEEACNVLVSSGKEEPLKPYDIVEAMQVRGKEVVCVADALYWEYDRPISMRFNKTYEE